MIKLNQFPKTTKHPKKRLGRGMGSGRGKTSGRGTKGQKSRKKISKKLGIAGTSFIRRLPLYRGKLRNKPIRQKPLAVNLKYLNVLPGNSTVDLDLLIKHHIIDKESAFKYGIKILGDGELSIPLVVKLPCSKNAANKIEKAGGKVEK